MVRTLGDFTLGGNGLGALFKSFDFRASLGLLPVGSGAAGRAGAGGGEASHTPFPMARGGGGAGGGRRWRAWAVWGASAVAVAGGPERLRVRRRWERRHLFPHARRKQQCGEAALRSFSRARFESYDQGLKLANTGNEYIREYG
jgi:hypothetical protein